MGEEGLLDDPREGLTEREAVGAGLICLGHPSSISITWYTSVHISLVSAFFSFFRLQEMIRGKNSLFPFCPGMLGEGYLPNSSSDHQEASGSPHLGAGKHC